MKGGTGCTNEVKFKNENWGTICTPTKKGYEFQGWKDSNGNNVTRLGKATKSLDLTAQWELTKPYYNDFGGYYKTLQGAINNTASGTIHLVQNYDDSNSATLNDKKTLTFNVEGHTLNLTQYNISVKKGTLTVKNGTINTTTKDSSAIEVSGGTLNIESGTTIHCSFKATKEEGTEAIRITGGTVNMKGGMVSSGINTSTESKKSSYARAVYLNGTGTFNMTGGEVHVYATKNNGYGGTGINNQNGTVILKNAKVIVEKGGRGRCGLCANARLSNPHSSKSYVKNGTTIKINGHVSNGKSGGVLWSDAQSSICYENGVSLTCTGASGCTGGTTRKITKKANGKCNP